MSAPNISIEYHAFVVDISTMTEDMAGFGWRAASPTEIPALVELGERLTDQSLAAPDVVERVQKLTGISAWAFADPIEGLVLCVPLSETGLAALQNSDFHPGSPDDSHIAAAGTLCAGCYIGVYAGETHAARKAVMTAAAIIRMKLFSQVPCFARAATEDGARSMVSLGWAPAGFGPDKLWMQGALSAPEKKVA